MALYTYSFSEKKRDLTDVLSTVVKDEPRFISNFQTCRRRDSAKNMNGLKTRSPGAL